MRAATKGRSELQKMRDETPTPANCKCGWTFSATFDVDCDCYDCNVESVAHRAHHDGIPMRKPMIRASARDEAQAAKQRPALAKAIERRYA